MSQIVAAMRRQLPTARRLLESVAQPGIQITDGLAPGMSPTELVQLLTRFVQAFEPGGSPASEIGSWVKVGPILHRAAQGR